MAASKLDGQTIAAYKQASTAWKAAGEDEQATNARVRAAAYETAANALRETATYGQEASNAKASNATAHDRDRWHKNNSTLAAEAGERAGDSLTKVGEHERAVAAYKRAASMWTAAGDDERAKAASDLAAEAATAGRVAVAAADRP